MGLAAGLSLVGGLFNAVGAIQQGNAEASMYRYQAAVAEQNAAFASAEGEVKADQAGLKGASDVAKTTAAIAARGVDVNKGSAVKVIESADKLQLMDTYTIRSDAAREAYAYHVQSAGDNAAAKSAQTAGYLRAAAGIFGAFGSFFGQAGLGGLAGVGQSGIIPMADPGFMPMSAAGGPVYSPIPLMMTPSMTGAPGSVIGNRQLLL